MLAVVFFFQAEDGIRYLVRSRGLGDVYKRQRLGCAATLRLSFETVRIHSLLLAAWAFLFADFTASAQENAPVNGPHDRAELPIALVHATVHVSPTETLTDATVLIQGERILEVGKRVRVPAGAEVHDLSGLHVWPGLIDPVSYTHLRAHETVLDLVCRLLLEKTHNTPSHTASTAN